MRKFFSFVAGSISGALVGSVVALLMAPSSGDELRGSAQSRLDGFLNEVRRASAERRAELEAELEMLKRGEAPKV
jgi:gas vesicle protein